MHFEGLIRNRAMLFEMIQRLLKCVQYVCAYVSCYLRDKETRVKYIVTTMPCILMVTSIQLFKEENEDDSASVEVRLSQ